MLAHSSTRRDVLVKSATAVGAAIVMGQDFAAAGTSIRPFRIAVPEEKLAAAFDYMFQKDPFSGHVVIRSTDSGKVLGFLEKGKLNSHHDWKHRFKENSERMRTGALLEVAVVLKSLVSLSTSKPLSFREKKMLERAKYLLVSEMATARNTSAENAEATVVKSLAKAKLQFPVMTEKFE